MTRMISSLPFQYSRGKSRILSHWRKSSSDYWKTYSRCLLSSSAMHEIPESGTDENPHYPQVFSPLHLNDAIGTLPNRFIMGSMHTGLEGHSIPKMLVPLLNPDHDHDDLSAMALYFKKRAEGGVGLMVTGGISPNKAGWVGPFASKLNTIDEMEMHKVVTSEVHSVQIPSYGEDNNNSETARICMQILHAGRYAMHPFAVSASSTKAPISPFQARELSLGEIQSTIRDFVYCAVLAREAGYDGVEIMGSEGYLINQFLVSATNKRTDAYGGDQFHNRMRFAVDIVRQTRQAVGEDFIIIFRLSMLDLVKDGSSWEEIKILAQAIEDAGATIINTGIGWHEARVPTIATSVPRGAFSWVTKKMKDEGIVDIPLCTTNRINAPHIAEKIIHDGNADLVSMARPFLADPMIVEKSRTGRSDEINSCIACNQACLDHVFVGKTSSCLVNPLACHETELTIQENSVPLEKRLNIGVIGSGPAGLSFAITAAKIGHHVTLYDKSNELGGQFNMAKRIPGKEEFHETIRYFNSEIRRLQKRGKLNVNLGREISYEDMKADTNTNKWIVATGVGPRTPSIPGINHPNVLSYIDVLKHKKRVGKNVAIIGAGGIGFDVAEYLLHTDDEKTHDITADDVNLDSFLSDWAVDSKNDIRGGLLEHSSHPESVHVPKRNLVLMQRKKGKLGKNLGKTTGWIHRATLIKSNAVEMLDSVSYEKIDENGNLHIQIKNGNEVKERVLEVDNIVLCAGQNSLKDLEIASKDDSHMSEKVYTIGGAYEALELDAKRAIDMGTRLALKIDDESVIPGKHKFESGKGTEEKMFALMKKYMKF